MPRVYLAGKMAPDWRRQLVEGWAQLPLGQTTPMRDGWTYGGPWVVPPPRHHGDALRQWREGLERADAVFCWVTDVRAFNTLVEIGAALAWGLPVGVYGPATDLQNALPEWWLVQALCPDVAPMPSVLEAWERFRAWAGTRWARPPGRRQGA
jgi:hypothetical protein